MEGKNVRGLNKTVLPQNKPMPRFTKLCWCQVCF